MSLFTGDQGLDLTWHAHAACAGMGAELFYPERGDNNTSAEAKAVCRDCPVKQECLDYAITTEQRFGLWGGLSERERRRLRRGRRPARPAATVDHCAHGHPYNAENTYVTADGSKRRCRRCAREASERKRRADGVPERGVPADGQELADVIQIRRPA